jgi:hypothetical protein
VTSVLLVRLSAMGDLVHGLGVVRALHRARPDWRISIVTQSTFAPLLEGLEGLSRVVTFRRRGGLGEIRRLRADLRSDTYDVALDLQGNWKSAGIAWLSGARERIGAGAAWRQEPRSRWLLHRTIEIAGERHPARVAFSLARVLVPELPFLVPQLVATAAELENERAAVRSMGVDVERPFRVIVVTDPSDPRALRPAVVAAQAAQRSPQDLPTLLVLGPAESAVSVPPEARVLRHGRGEVRRLVALGALVANVGGRGAGARPGRDACPRCRGRQLPRRLRRPGLSLHGTAGRDRARASVAAVLQPMPPAALHACGWAGLHGLCAAGRARGLSFARRGPRRPPAAPLKAPFEVAAKQMLACVGFGGVLLCSHGAAARSARRFDPGHVPQSASGT